MKTVLFVTSQDSQTILSACVAVRQLLDWQYSNRLCSRTENNCCFMLCLHL